MQANGRTWHEMRRNWIGSIVFFFVGLAGDALKQLLKSANCVVPISFEILEDPLMYAEGLHVTCKCIFQSAELDTQKVITTLAPYLSSEIEAQRAAAVAMYSAVRTPLLNSHYWVTSALLCSVSLHGALVKFSAKCSVRSKVSINQTMAVNEIIDQSSNQSTRSIIQSANQSNKSINQSINPFNQSIDQSTDSLNQINQSINPFNQSIDQSWLTQSNQSIKQREVFFFASRCWRVRNLPKKDKFEKWSATWPRRTLTRRWSYASSVSAEWEVWRSSARRLYVFIEILQKINQSINFFYQTTFQQRHKISI